MDNLATVEIKAFVPARDFELSKRFYQDLGFTMASSSDVIAYFHHGGSSFLLQNCYVEAAAENFTMHMLVEDVEAWWRQARGVAAQYGMKTEPPSDQTWRIRDFALTDPSGVLWRIGQNI